jgi:hypothetical protein
MAKGKSLSGLWLISLFLLLSADLALSKVMQTDGSAASLQGAINNAKVGDTIIVPSGSFTWYKAVTCSKFVHIQGAGSSSTKVSIVFFDSDCLQITPSNDGSIEVSGIAFVQGSGGTANYHHLAAVFDKPGARPVLIHDCAFAVNSNAESCLLWATNGGIIWNCRFSSNDIPNDEGIQLKISAASTQRGDYWQSPSTMGSDDTNGVHNTYIEDCTFTDMLTGAVDTDDNSRSVIRHCTFNNSAIGSHGQETSPWGNRHWEVYNNTFIFTAKGSTPYGGAYPVNLNYWHEVRGGTGVIFGNVMPHIRSQDWGDKAGIILTDFNIRRSSNNISCQTHYPSARQPGQTWIGAKGYAYQGALIDGSGYGTDPVYIWGNTDENSVDPALLDYNPDDCRNNQTVTNYIRLGRDYVLDAKPGYSPYPYPHPLRTGSNASPGASAAPGVKPALRAAPNPTPLRKSTPTSTLRAVPTSPAAPSVTANPVVTPTPNAITAATPGFKYYQWQGKLNYFLQNAVKLDASQIKQIDAFIQSNPPGQMDQFLKNTLKLNANQIKQIDAFIRSIPPRQD